MVGWRGRGASRRLRTAGVYSVGGKTHNGRLRFGGRMLGGIGYCGNRRRQSHDRINYIWLMITIG